MVAQPARLPSCANLDGSYNAGMGIERKGRDQFADESLGMNVEQGITRRDFLNATLLASGGMLLNPLSPADILANNNSEDDWTGYGGVGDYAHSNGNTLAVVNAGHQIRDHAFESLPQNLTDTGEIYDCVIVGGGISGLAAALIFQRHAGPGRTCLVLDNHPVFGGEAKRNEFLVGGHRLVAHQGSAFFPVPYPHSFIARFYESIGLEKPRLDYQAWDKSAPEIQVSRTPYLSGGAASGFYFGAKFGEPKGLWVIDPWGKKLAGAPISARARAELLRYQGVDASPASIIAGSGAPQYPGDVISRRLDTITLEDHLMEKYGISRETVRTFLSPVEGGGYGLGPDALSGYTAYAADMLHPLDIGDETGDQMFPDGNSGFARLIVKSLIPESIGGERTLEAICRNAIDFAALDRGGSPVRIRLDSTVVWVKHEGDSAKSEFVNLVYTRGGKSYRVRARTVVMAGGSWTTKHIVRDLPAEHAAAYAEFYRSPCLMANVAVRNWQFLYKMGISGCQWFDGIGNYLQVRKLATCGADAAAFGPDSPTVLTIKILYSYPGLSTEEQGQRGRAEMISTSFRDYERQLRQQLTDMFAHSGFDASRDIGGIILNRWGHAYLSPAPGFFFGSNGKPAPSEVLRAAPFGRIAFANTDLSGVMDHRYSILEADRAVGQLLDQVLE